jgi:hypothetical protein
VLLVFFLLSIIATWPTALHLTTQGLGEHHVDRAQSIWNLWWVKVALLDRHTNPFHTDLLFYPQGADLYLHDLSLPAKVILLAPMLLLGPIGAYNFGMMLALTLTAYAGFRLVHYLTGSYLSGLFGGLIAGFNPLMQEWLRGHINLLNAQWFVLTIEFYLRSWADGRRRDAILAGVFAALALLTIGYYEIYLLIFFILHLLWAFRFSVLDFASRIIPSSSPKPRTPIPQLVRRGAFVLTWAGGTALLLTAPYIAGAWSSLQKGQIILRSDLDVERTVVDSADLLSFIVPDRDHWLLGIHSPWWAWIDPAIHEYTTLGIVLVALAVAGAWAGRGAMVTWFWAALALLGVVLSLGPVLRINGRQTFGGVEIPLPYNLLQSIPPFSAMRAPERYVFMTYIALAVLAGAGVAAIRQWRLPVRGWLKDALAGYSPLVVALGILLLIELPFHYRFTEPMPIPGSMAALGRDPAPGAVLELPMTQHGWVDTPRMYYQTAHGRPITGGYLSRPIIDPYTQACSPFQTFSAYEHTEEQDIVSPTVASMVPQLLADNGVGFVAVYKQVYIQADKLSPLPKRELDGLQATANQLGTLLSDDDIATTYRLRPTSGHAGLFLQLGPDWHRLETSEGGLFRWMNGPQADFCIFSPAAQTAHLAMHVTSFASPRHLQIWMGDAMVLDAQVAADGALHAVSAPSFQWPAGPQKVRIVVPEGSASPAGLGLGTDQRQLSLGFASITLEKDPP